MIIAIYFCHNHYTLSCSLLKGNKLKAFRVQYISFSSKINREARKCLFNESMKKISQCEVIEFSLVIFAFVRTYIVTVSLMPITGLKAFMDNDFVYLSNLIDFKSSCGTFDLIKPN